MRLFAVFEFLKILLMALACHRAVDSMKIIIDQNKERATNNEQNKQNTL